MNNDERQTARLSCFKIRFILVCYFRGWYSYACCITLLSCFAFITNAQTKPSAPPDFKGKYIIALSDADMPASAYIDGKLGPGIGKDQLTVLSLAASGNNQLPSTADVSNSVTGPPASITVSRDGRYAIAIETLGPRKTQDDNDVRKDLPPGKEITVIDISDSKRPHVIQRLQGQQHPVSLSINPKGNLVVIGYGTPAKGKISPIIIYRFNDGHLSDSVVPAIPGWGDNDDVGNVSFYKDDILAAISFSRPVLVFFKIQQLNNSLQLQQWGNAVGLDKGPFLTRFTANDRFALVNAMYFGPDVSTSPRGTVSSIQIAAATAKDGSPVHQLVSHAETGYGPEGLAVSPDGKWVVTSNLEQSFDPKGDIKQGFYASLTLLSLDTAGRLHRIADFPFSGILPETVLFDNSSRYIAVNVYDHFDDKPAGASIDFWRLSTDFFDSERFFLVQTGYSVPVKRGAHSMVLIP